MELSAKSAHLLTENTLKPALETDETHSLAMETSQKTHNPPLTPQSNTNQVLRNPVT